MTLPKAGTSITSRHAMATVVPRVANAAQPTPDGQSTPSFAEQAQGELQHASMASAAGELQHASMPPPAPQQSSLDRLRLVIDPNRSTDFFSAHRRRSMPTCELVLSTYGPVDEVADALDALSPAGCSTAYVYSKSDNCSAVNASAPIQAHAANMSIVCVPLQNLGREQYVWFHHATTRWAHGEPTITAGGFAEWVHFVPLPLDRHWERLATLRAAMSPQGPLSSSFYCTFFEVLDPRTRDPRLNDLSDVSNGYGNMTSPADISTHERVEHHEHGRRAQLYSGQNILARALADGGESLPDLNTVGGSSDYNTVFANAVRMGYPTSDGCGTNGWQGGWGLGRPCLDFYKTNYINSQGQVSALAAADVEPLWRWELMHANVDPFVLSDVPVCYYGGASTTRANLLSRQPSVYKSLRTQLAVADETEAAHYGERLMAAHFGPPVEHWGRGGVDARNAFWGAVGAGLGGLLLIVACIYTICSCCRSRQPPGAGPDEAKPLQPPK